MAAGSSRAPSARPSHTLRSTGGVLHVEKGGARHVVLIWMVLAIAVATCLAWWDTQREADAVLRDVAREQAVLASICADDLRGHLAAIERDALLTAARGPSWAQGRYAEVAIGVPATDGRDESDATHVPLRIPVPDGRIAEVRASLADLLDTGTGVEPSSERAVFLVAPGYASFYTQGSRVAAPLLATEGFDSLRDALDRGIPTVRLNRSEAAELGLLARTAMASLMRVDAAALGRWAVIAVGTAARPRDRESRAFWRLVLGVGVTSCLVLAFGGLAMRNQRKELEVSHRLVTSELEHQRDEKLLHAERAATMGTFAMGIAHEVSTPLGVIVGRAEQLIERLREDERASRGAAAILKEAERIRHIVRRFLDMARGGPLSLARTDPSFVVRAAFEALEHRFAKAKVSLVTGLPDAMPAIECDGDLLAHAIVILMLNGCEAAGSGGRVEVVVRSEGERVVFVVADDGAGISAEDAARATEPIFATGGAARRDKLGLAIAAEIAKSHRGGLSIAPNTPRGTRASIEIPIADDGASMRERRGRLPSG